MANDASSIETTGIEDIRYTTVPPEQLPKLLADTIENTTTQKLLAAKGMHQIGQTKKVGEILEILENMNQALLEVVRHPDQPIPINSKTTNRPIIDLNLVKKKAKAA